ncbi:uracil-DNA glycosylase-like isoform X2 [Rhodnius prolixus]|uniref:uracil-DNA glycosylase-like isoform X2 n=1 Tax=Rhodnius prolixus TaxID=13249 RepID=UPI003D18FAF3
MEFLGGNVNYQKLMNKNVPHDVLMVVVRLYPFISVFQKLNCKPTRSTFNIFKHCIRMSGQKKLSSFFKTVPKKSKRPLSEANENDSPSKRQKVEGEKDKKIDTSNKKADSLQSSLSNGSFFEDNIKQEIVLLSKKLCVIDPNIGPSWYKALKSEFKKPYFEKLNHFVEEERKKGEVYPPTNQVWSWTRECSMDKVKVVILGQDPYHNPRQAHGLCFSVQLGVQPPPSLINMYKELETDIEGFKAPKHGHLIGWARQGVLLLNAVLTVKKNNPNSHKDQGWENLTTAVIKYLNDHHRGIVFLLWGSYAQKKASFVDQKKHHVLKTVHPSPLSAQRGWFGCKHFSKCNELLKQNGKKPIDWNQLPEQ